MDFLSHYATSKLVQTAGSAVRQSGKAGNDTSRREIPALAANLSSTPILLPPSEMFEALATYSYHKSQRSSAASVRAQGCVHFWYARTCKGLSWECRGNRGAWWDYRGAKNCRHRFYACGYAGRVAQLVCAVLRAFPCICSTSAHHPTGCSMNAASAMTLAAKQPRRHGISEISKRRAAKHPCDTDVRKCWD